MKLFIVLTWFILTATSLLKSQSEFPDVVNPRDSCNYMYRFTKGDTLLYEAISRDSIVIDKQPALLRDRKERILLICDSVDNNGLMHLSQRLIDITSSEYSGISQIIDRENHEWKNTIISFIIDSTGNRHGFNANDSSRAKLSPGSAFQPLMMQFLGIGFHLINSGWIAEDTVDVPEFGIPAPMIRYLSSMRARPIIDTLGLQCSRFESTISAQGTYQTTTASHQDIRTTSIIAGFAQMSMSTLFDVPVHFFGTNENKNTMYITSTKGSIEQKVKHYVTTTVTLQQMISQRGIYGIPAKSKSTKKKSKKK